MYNIIAKCPRYDNRDAVVGYSLVQFNDYSYESLALARYFAQKNDDSCYGDIAFSVVDSSGKDVTYDPSSFSYVVQYDDDIPF
jgi:hypothetical protein